MTAVSRNISLNQPFVVVEIEEQMRLFDALPKNLRHLIWELPVDMEMRQIRNLHHAGNTSTAIRRILSEMKTIAPRWTPPHGQSSARPSNLRSP